MPEDIDQTRREDIRRAVRTYLAERPVVALSIPTIHRGLRAEWPDLREREVSASIGFLESLKQVDSVTEQLGATKYFKITAEGILAHERS